MMYYKNIRKYQKLILFLLVNQTNFKISTISFQSLYHQFCNFRLSNFDKVVLHLKNNFIITNFIFNFIMIRKLLIIINIYIVNQA